ncbi:MAG: glycosyltransferase family 9 protein [Limisphaerales bacterium]
MTGPEHFLWRTRDAKKVLVLDLGFLGDTVHLLPALWMVRQAYPRAELHAAVAAHIASLMDCVPWLNRVWGYMRYPRHATLRENLDFIRRVRLEKFDVVINLNGSDRSSWLTFLSGAPERLGRLPDDGGPPFWRRMFTESVRHPFGNEPMYLQRCRCLEKAGFPFTPPQFNVEIPSRHLAAAGILETECGTYFHISPFTTADFKELAPAQLAELAAALQKEFPEKKLVLSCASDRRELEKMENLLALLPQKPWRVFPGNLDLVQLAAVIKHSAAHFCGDTGTLHLAVMTRTPIVTWFWPNPGLAEWVPADDLCRMILGSNPPGENFLCGIGTDALVGSAKEIAV